MFETCSTQLGMNMNAVKNIAVVAAHRDAGLEIERACAMIRATVVPVESESDLAKLDAAADVPLALVSATELEWSSQALLSDLRSRGVARTVMIGPTFGTTAHRMALDIGFDEVWASGVSTSFLAALIRGQLRQRISPGWSRPTLADRLGLVIDRSSFTCQYGDRELDLNQSQIETLDLLLRRAPAAVPRLEIESLIPELGRGANSRVADVLMSRLRRRLKDQGVEGSDILCSRGIGYRIVDTRSRMAEDAS